MAEVIRRQKRYQIDVRIESDRDKEQLQMFIEGVLQTHRWHFKVEDVAVYEVVR